VRGLLRNNEIISLVQEFQDKQGFKELHWEGSFEDYLEIIKKKPRLARSAFQRVYDMILSYGTEVYTVNKEQIIKYRFFDDPISGCQDAVYGLERPIMKMVNFFKAAAQRYGAERRVLLLHGPVGSAKSTIVRLLKKGLERYSLTDEGAIYSFRWRHGEKSDMVTYAECPMREEPLHLIPTAWRGKLLDGLNEGFSEEQKIYIEGEPCPFCRHTYRELLKKHKGDWVELVSNEVRVYRFVLSEKDRIGIGTFQPKDEKNQDSTELTGDINYRKIAEYGSDSDPRAFNFDGEFNIANRGLVEFIEILKLDVAFLYDLLGATQEHKIKPKKFAQTDIDEVIIGHTNEPEYRRLQSNEYMEALRDRTIKIDFPYVTKLSDEIKIYGRDFNPTKIRGRHIAPHTIEMASMWAVATRLELPKDSKITILQKLRLYDGKSLSGYTEDNIRDMQKEAVREGMDGISPRYIQDKISNALVSMEHDKCINPFMVLNELGNGLQHHSLITAEEKRKHYRELLAVVMAEYEDITKTEVQKAISADEESLKKLCTNYLENVKAYTQRTKVKNKYTGQDEPPDERLMRAIEEKIDIPETRKDDFRREVMNYIGALALNGKTFSYNTNERLQKAFELKLFEDQKDTIKLTTLVTGVVDKDTQEKIDVVKARLIRDYAYCEVCATDVLNYVASIFARGDIKGVWTKK